MIRRPPRSTRTDTLFPYTTLFRSSVAPSSKRIAILPLVGTLVKESMLFRRTPPRAVTNTTWRFFHSSSSSGNGSTVRSEEHTSELQSLMRNSYAVFCLKKKKRLPHPTTHHHQCRLKQKKHDK